MINGNMCVLRDAKRRGGNEREGMREEAVLICWCCRSVQPVLKREEGSQGVNESLLGIAKRRQLQTHQESGK